jgi:hypothetical protein
MTSVSLGTDKVTFEELERKYRNFMGPGYRLKIGDVDVVRRGMAVANLKVETTATQEADVVTFSVANAYDAIKRDFAWLDDLLVLGKELEVQLGYADKLLPVFYGYITAVNVTFADDGTPEIQVTGMDMSFKFMRGRTVKAWANQKISDIVRGIAQAHRVPKCVVDDTAQPIPVLMRKPQNDYQFLQDLAQSINYEFFIVGQTLYFRRKNTNKNPLTTLEWGKHLMKIAIEQNLSEQVTKVRVRGWDAKNQQPINEASSQVNRIGSNSRTGADLLKSLGGEFEEVLYLNVSDPSEARKLAEAAMNERALRLVTGEAECLGIPEIRAGRYIRLEGLGKRMSQPYYIIKATHAIDDSGYVTSFTFQGNAV